jgi:hypothetical protein
MRVACCVPNMPCDGMRRLAPRAILVPVAVGEGLGAAAEVDEVALAQLLQRAWLRGDAGSLRRRRRPASPPGSRRAGRAAEVVSAEHAAAAPAPPAARRRLRRAQRVELFELRTNDRVVW